MKRKLLLFLAVLIVMLAVKYALGQSENTSIRWSEADNCMTCSDSLDSSQDLGTFLLAAPIAGMAFALVRMGLRDSSRPLLEPLRLR